MFWKRKRNIRLLEGEYTDHLEIVASPHNGHKRGNNEVVDIVLMGSENDTVKYGRLLDSPF